MRTKIAQCEKLRPELSAPCRRNLRWIEHFFALILLSSLAGCFSTEIKPYPSTWPQLATAPAGQCPNISGDYENTGDGEWDDRRCVHRKYPGKAEWNCDNSLAGNLIKMKAVEWSELSYARNIARVKLQQPDPDTLEVYIPSEGSLPKIFKHSQGDFDCDGSSLKFSMTGSAFSAEKSSTAGDIVMTTGELLLYAAVGVDSTERVFRPLQDGSLSMEATESNWGTVLVLFNFHIKRNAFVRWERYQPGSSEKTSRRHLTIADVSAADYTKFQTLDGRPGYSIQCKQGWRGTPCNPKIYDEANTLCEGKGYSVISDTFNEGANSYQFALSVQCKE